MLMKWIVCHVPETQKGAFSRAQRAWSALRNADGFYGQWGGWNYHRPTEAGILSLWRDQPSYDAFMSRVHDSIFLANKQEQTYQSISVTLLRCVSSISGDKKDIRQALSGRWIRMSDYRVRQDRSSFITARQSVWNPALSQAEGLLAGAVGQAVETPNRYLVFSLWRDEQVHAQSVKQVPGLQNHAGTDRDALSVSHHLFRLEEEWLVLP